ncbi:PREDICTED: cysteine-rich repeat secretory protein 18-like [Camelina sativa]|uniref:Cysteine-rich repeat secretory protein 18-like n=1 Tax=Camelina sativa TaxID=90675 RepID=A0ABM1R0E4_CAMSA|nr:PREDICTED: cysteine-rich repeat secretory protein 18-like [Camelina sativa]
MHSSSSVSKRLVLIPILVVAATQLLLLHSVSSLNRTNAYLHHKCLVSEGQYKPGSQYEKAFNELIKSFSDGSYNFHYGWGFTAMGKEPDMIAITYQCRVDSRGPKCGTCVINASSELLRKRCPRDRGAVIWYDQCIVEFSRFNTIGQINYDDNFCMPSVKNLSGDSISFENRLFLLYNLTSLAITKIDENIKGVKTPVRYAAGEKRLGKKNLYGMVQCSGGLTVKGCQECIKYYIIHYQDCWKHKQGVRVLSPSCNFRYELYSFINPTSPYYTKF